MQRELAIAPEDNSETLHDRFGHMAAEWVPEILQGLREETIQALPQEETLATECGKITKEDGAIHWQETANMIHNRIRAYQPWPGAYFPLGEKGNLKVLQAQTEEGVGKPGELLELRGEGPLIACGERALRLLWVQPPGKKPMDGKSFLNGYSLQPGTVFPSA